MKILWLTHRDPLNPKAGGAERIAEAVSTRLGLFGDEITIFAPKFKGAKNEEEINGYRIIRTGGIISSHLTLPFYLLKENFDIVIADLGHAIPWISPRVMKKKLVVHFLHLHRRSLPGQVNSFLAFVISAIERCYFLLYPTTKFVTISKTSLSDLTEKIGINSKNCTIIRPGVNSELYFSRSKTEQPSLIYFGGMREYKRPYEVLYVFKRLMRIFPNISLTLVGSGPPMAKMIDISEKLQISPRINFKGRISSEELSRLVGSSWLNIHTSITEGWGISIIEAASAGTPTVGYDVPGVTESIESEMNGIKVKDGDRDALYKAAKRILAEPKPWWASSLEVANKYSWDRAAEEWHEVLKSEIETKKHRQHMLC